jgi:hypothetical protein
MSSTTIYYAASESKIEEVIRTENTIFLHHHKPARFPKEPVEISETEFEAWLIEARKMGTFTERKECS